MTDEGKVKCKLCNYQGFPPVLRLHLYWAHGITFEDDK